MILFGGDSTKPVKTVQLPGVEVTAARTHKTPTPKKTENINYKADPNELNINYKIVPNVFTENTPQQIHHIVVPKHSDIACSLAPVDSAKYYDMSINQTVANSKKAKVVVEAYVNKVNQYETMVLEGTTKSAATKFLNNAKKEFICDITPNVILSGYSPEKAADALSMKAETQADISYQMASAPQEFCNKNKATAYIWEPIPRVSSSGSAPKLGLDKMPEGGKETKMYIPQQQQNKVPQQKDKVPQI